MRFPKPKPALLLAAVAVLASGLRAQDRMTLQQFLDTAVENSLSLRVAGQAVTAAGDKVREARSAYLPQVALAGSYTRMSLVSEFDIPDLGHFKFGTPDNFSFRLAASEQVFNWGRTARSVELGRLGRTLALENASFAAQTLSYQIVPIFYGVLYTQEAVKVIDATLDLLDGKLAILKERYQAGLASDFDLSLLSVQIAGLRSQKLDFENNVRKMMIAYNRIAGRPLDSTFVPEGTLSLESVMADQVALLAEAQANRVEARQIESRRSMAETQIALTRTLNKPTVSAAFNFEFRNGFLPSVGQIRGNWNAVLAVSYPVFDGNRTSAQVAQAEVALRTIDEQSEDLVRGFAQEIDQALSDLKTLELKTTVEEAKIAHAEKALRIADERYRNGLMSMTDLVEAQDSLDSARLNYLQLVYNHVLARYDLFQAVGRKIIS